MEERAGDSIGVWGLIRSCREEMRKDSQGIRPSQHGFMKGWSCMTNLISFYEQVTHLVDE